MMTDTVFFEPSRSFTVADVAGFTGARLHEASRPETTVSGIAPLSEGGEGKLVFLDRLRNVRDLAGLAAAAIFCRPDFAASVPPGIAILLSENPHVDFAAVARLLYPSAVKPGSLTGETGISDKAQVSPQAMVETGAIVEACAVVCAGAGIGAGTVIGPNAVIGPGVQIGRDGYVGPGCTVLAALIGNRVILHPGVRIGQDGFGYVPGARGMEKIPQIGRVVIQDDVEIGANTTVDRGMMTDTVIGEGTKIDNLVQIAHNVRIGRHCAIAAFTGISGSVTVGDGVLFGGRVGVADHLTIGSGARLAAASGVIRDVPAGARWAGYPAKPHKEHFREIATLVALSAKRNRKG